MNDILVAMLSGIAVGQTQQQMIMEYRNFESELYKNFARLVVEECIKCCEELQRFDDQTKKNLYLDPEIGPTQCIEVIKKRFGIDE